MPELIDRIRAAIANDPYYNQNFANDGERFLAWYLRNIYQRNAAEARGDITDGANDKEIDAVVVDDEKRKVIILQGKFYDNTAVDHQPLQEVLAAWMHIRDLPSLQATCNAKLRIKLEEIARALEDDYEVDFELVTTGVLTQAAQNDFATFRDRIAEFEDPESAITLVNTEIIQARWDEALARELPRLDHTFILEAGRYLEVEIGGVRTVLAAVPLAECIKMPGIADGRLFRKNVRQSLGLSNKVNKGLKQTLNSETAYHFFLYHNGITALCEELTLDVAKNQLNLRGMSVVNGCQSLSTILACSEKAKKAAGAHVLFRFYEIKQKDLADKISIYTNSQSAVKPRDLRSNDKRVIAIKRNYEARFPQGYFIAKRGEERPAEKDQTKTVDIVTLARCLAAWHLRLPSISSNENRLFDKHFEQLFRADYSPEDIDALNQWAQRIEQLWSSDQLALNEQLLATRSSSMFHLLFAVQCCFCAASKQLNLIPEPSATMAAFSTHADIIIKQAAAGFNAALNAAVNEYQSSGKVFSSQNWLKAKDSVTKIKTGIDMLLSMLGTIPGGQDLTKALTIPANKFGLLWVSE